MKSTLKEHPLVKPPTRSFHVDRGNLIRVDRGVFRPPTIDQRVGASDRTPDPEHRRHRRHRRPRPHDHLADDDRSHRRRPGDPGLLPARSSPGAFLARSWSADDHFGEITPRWQDRRYRYGPTWPGWSSCPTPGGAPSSGQKHASTSEDRC